MRCARGGARRRGRRDGRRRATPARRWPRRCCASAASRACPARRSRCRSRCPVSHPQLLVDGGATVDAAPEWLVQFALHGRVRTPGCALGIDEPHDRAALERRGGRARATTLRKRAYPLLARRCPGFIGNVEGRDLMHPDAVDVIVTDGFTGNVALEEPSRARSRSLARLVFARARRDARGAARPPRSCCRCCSRRAEAYDPDNTGGAVLLGVERRVRDLARLVVGAARSCNAIAGRGATACGADVVDAHAGGGRRCRLRPTSTQGPLGPDEVLAHRSASGSPRSSRSTRRAITPRRDASPTTSTPTRSRSSSSSRRSRRSSASAPSASASTTRTSPTCTPSATRSTTSSRALGAAAAVSRGRRRRRRSSALEAALGWHVRATARILDARARRTARTAPSTPTTASNERLEFLGDAVLGLVVTDHVFDDVPDAARGRARQAPGVGRQRRGARRGRRRDRARPAPARSARARTRPAGARSRRSSPTRWRR